MRKKVPRIKSELSVALDVAGSDVFSFVQDSLEIAKPDILLKAVRQELKNQKDAVKEAALHLLAAQVYIDKANYVDAAKEVLPVTEMENIPNKVLAYAYSTAAGIYARQGDFVRAEKFCKTGLALTEESEDKIFVQLVNTTANIHYFHGRFTLALEYYDISAGAARKLGLTDRAVISLSNSALALSLLGRTDEVITRLEEARELSQKAGDKRLIAQVALFTGDHYRNQGEPERALNETSEALAFYEQLGDRIRFVECHLEIARNSFAMKELDRAVEHAVKCLEYAEEFNQKIHISSACGLIGVIYASRGNPEAESYLKRSIDTIRAWSSTAEPEGIEFWLLEYGRLLMPKDKEKASKYIREAVVILKKRPSIDQVKRKLKEAQKMLQEIGIEPEATDEAASGEQEKSSENLSKALEISKALNSETGMQNVLNLILDAALEISGAERGFIVFLENGVWKTTVSRNFLGDITEDPEYSVIQESILRALELKKPVLAGSARTSGKFESVGISKPENVRTALVFPLRVGQSNQGCIYLDSRIAAMDISPDLEDFMTVIMEHAALAIAKASQYELVRGLSEKLEHKVERQSMELKRTRSELEKKQQELELRNHYKNIIGKSPKMREIFGLLDEVVDNNLPVCIGGESGTGKELIAKAIHYSGLRKKKNFIAINCAAIPETLMESELFGHEKGAFTGADRRKTGIFELADGGTLFLDEIGNMSMAMQQKLLRVVQESEIRRIGSATPVRIDVRIVSATNRNLSDLVAEGTFREDLFYRLNVLPITIPPLRERKEDIPLLVDFFWKKYSPHMEIPPDSIGELLRLLMDYDWPGNVRELENEINRLASLGRDGFNIEYLSKHFLEESGRGGKPAGIFLSEENLTLSEIERRCIIIALENGKGNKTKAARLLGIPRATIDSKMRKHNIKLAEIIYD